MKKSYAKLAGAAISAVLALSLTNCLNEQHPGSYYTFTDYTIASFLEKNSDEFSGFIQILKKANIWGEMATYGSYTCFAPTNQAIDSFLVEKNYACIDSIPYDICDTIARTHLLDAPYYTTDLIEGAFPSPNRLDRYLSFTCDSAIDGLRYYVNKDSWLMQMNDTVQNGVVHIVNRVIQPSTLMLPELIAQDTAVSLFYQALVLTKLNNLMENYKDESYVAPGGDSCTTGVYYHTGNEWEYAIFPENRYYKYTALIEPNSVYYAAGINNLEDLIAYAKQVYDESYPDDAGLYDDDFTNRRNPLNRFVAYHLLEFYGTYDQWNVTNTDILGSNFDRSIWDVEDFFETMMPHSFVRFCTPKSASPNGIYINRRGDPKNVPSNSSVRRGVRLLRPSEIAVEQDAFNGIYHYIDRILVYSDEVRRDVFNTRIRYDCTTMSPDFVNSGGRNRPGETTCTGMKNGYTKWWKFSDETLLSIRNRHLYFSSYEGDEVILQGIYDATVKLPPVPFDGTYEVRIGYTAMTSRGTIQAYFGADPNNMAPTDIPTDMTIVGTDPKVGWFSDGDCDDDAEIRLREKAMRNRGYMKGPDSYSNSGNSFRVQSGLLRRIITTQYMSAESDYYLRVRQLLDNNMAEMVYDYLELVPKSVYASDQGEDRH